MTKSEGSQSRTEQEEKHLIEYNIVRYPLLMILGPFTLHTALTADFGPPERDLVITGVVGCALWGLAIYDALGGLGLL